MYINVLYNIKDNKKKIRGMGGRQYLNQKHSQVINKKKIDRDGIRTNDPRVRKPALLSTMLNTMIAITKNE